MNKDTVQGSAKQVVGAIKEVAGKAVGNDKLVAVGKAEKAAGASQSVVGSVKTALSSK